jgi:hypothetical protein
MLNNLGLTRFYKVPQTQQKVKKKLWDSCNKKYKFTTENIDFYEYVPSQIIFIKEV